MREVILKYIISLYEEYPKENRIRHHSYCMYPGDDCSCKYLKEVTYDTDLINGGYMDSFEMVLVLAFLEKTFKVNIPDKEATVANFNNINKMAELVEKHGGIYVGL